MYEVASCHTKYDTIWSPSKATATSKFGKKRREIVTVFMSLRSILSHVIQRLQPLRTEQKTNFLRVDLDTTQKTLLLVKIIKNTWGYISTD